MENYMKSNKLSRSDLANELGVTKGYISQILNGDFDHRLSKFVELSIAIGMIPQINYIPMDKLFAEETKVELSIGNIKEDTIDLPKRLRDFDVKISKPFLKVEKETIYKKNLKLSEAA